MDAPLNSPKITHFGSNKQKTERQNDSKVDAASRRVFATKFPEKGDAASRRVFATKFPEKVDAASRRVFATKFPEKGDAASRRVFCLNN